MSYKAYTKISTRRTPQSEAIPNSSQVENSAGRFVWELDKWGRLDRFLVIGSDSSTYYITSPALTKDNANVIIECLKEDGIRVVNRIVEISKSGRAAKNDPAIFALAMSIGLGDENTRKLASASISDVCRIGTHLFHFAMFVEQFRGWGRLLKRGVADWYATMPTDKLAYQVVKYRQRDGWSHRDLIRLSHPVSYPEHNVVFDWVAGRDKDGRGSEALALPIIKGFELAQQATEPQAWAYLVKEYNLPREALPTEALKSKEVWEALLEKMPITAMIRNLGNMSKVGLLVPMSEASATVAERLGNQEALTKARVHPIQILSALITYESGESARGSGTWDPVAPIVDALDGAFYKSFGNVESSGKRTMLALDVSGSMGWKHIMNIPGLTAMKGAAAMSLITAATEPNYMITAFASATSRRYGGMHTSYFGDTNASNIDDGMRQITISPRMRLDSVIKQISGLPFGGTDCALPMLYALKHGIDIDTFVVYTDSETWAGNIHPTQALRQYREKTGINAKLIVCGMTSNGFTISDPSDAGMLDVVGFDVNTPSIISEFSKGSF